MDIKQTDPTHPLHRSKGMVLVEIMDKVLPHVARIHLSATVGPDILSSTGGWANPGLALRHGRVKSSHWRFHRDSWGREDGNI